MIGWSDLDRVLRGETAGGVRAGPLAMTNLLLAAGYGACMGVFGLLNRDEPVYRQVVASVVKVPALFVLTLLVTFPSLYVFNTLLGSRLRLPELARLLAAATAVLAAVLAAFGPIVAFFSVTTTSYPFVLLLNVAVFAAAGAFGVGFLFRALNQLAGTLADAPAGTNRVIYVWTVVFGLVGAQMGWVLRPFVGSPHLPFTWFRPREASFVEGVLKSVRQLVGP